MTQEYLTWSDLQALASSPTDVRQKFQSLYDNVSPDGIALNDTTYFNAVQPPITQQYGHYCYKRLGEISYAEGTVNERQIVVGSNVATNDSDEPATISLTVEGAWSETTGWESSVTAGMSFTAEVTLKGIFKFGIGFNISTTIGKSGSNTTSRGASSTVTVTVPPHSSITVDMVAMLKSETVSFSAPIAVEGYFGANFPDRVRDHYFWFEPANTILPQTSGTLTGIVEGSAAFDVQTKIRPPQALA